MKTGALLAVFLLLVPIRATANDGFGGLTATGLQFGKSASVRMLSEELFLSPQQVRVRYLFRNDTKETVQGEVIFPLPPIALAELQESGFALPEEKLQRDNVVDFTALVNGKKIAVSIERIAVIEPPYDAARQNSTRYDAPGKDVTAELKGFGIPLSLDVKKVAAALARLPQPVQAKIKARGLADFFPGDPAVPAWSIIERYHWPQTFAPGQEVTIEHSYHPAPPGGIFVWPKKPEDLDPYQHELIRTYCIDAPTQKAIRKLIHPSTRPQSPGTGTALLLDYVLTTANTWHGPIGRFHLTIDKGHPRNVLSLCMEGIHKTGPTTFEVEQQDYRPERDLRLLIVTGLDN